MPDIRQQVGVAARRMRLASGMSQEELAERAGLDRTYISGLERGVRNPTLTTMERVAAALGVSLRDLFIEGTTPNPHGLRA